MQDTVVGVCPGRAVKNLNGIVVNIYSFNFLPELYLVRVTSQEQLVIKNCPANMSSTFSR